MRNALITGITGQDGSYLAELLLDKGYQVHGIIRRSSSFNTGRIDHIFDRLHLHHGDLSDSSSVSRLLHKIAPDEIYHLGAQSHVRVSFDAPEYTADITGLGTVRLLEAIRESGAKPRFYQASSSEMFGKVQEIPQCETTPFYPRSPYGCAKVFAYWTTVNYRESYGLHASNGILFNHECMTEETPIIFRKNDWIDIAEIQELVPHRANPQHGKKYQSLPKNLEIWDGGQWSRVTAATATWNAGEKEIFRVNARGGLYCATGDHKSFLEGRVEVDTRCLAPGDQLQLFPLPPTTGEASLTAEEAEFLGLMVGDGFICPDGGSARFTNLDEKLLCRAEDLFLKLTGGKSRPDFSKVSGFTPGKVIPSLEFSGAISHFKLWRAETYNERGRKKIPKRVLNAPLSVQLAFLKGYNAADGLKSKTCKSEFKCWVTNSSVLAAGLWFLGQAQGWRIALNWDSRGYYRMNVGEAYPKRGKHFLRPLSEIKNIKKIDHRGWLFDLATESGTFSAGVGQTWVHNSPRRGETFVTRKITRAIGRILAGLQDHLYLGNLDAKRDWGFAKEYVEAMWLMLQQDRPDDYTIATGETHSVREFLDEAFSYVGLDWQKYVIIDPKYFRPTEVDLLIGDPSKAKRQLGWEPKTTFKQLVRLMVDHDRLIPCGVE